MHKQCNLLLAKVGVERSNRFTRSILSKVSKPRFAGAFVHFGAMEIAGQGSRQKGCSYRAITNLRNRHSVNYVIDEARNR
jgi:hypothetical protein